MKANNTPEVIESIELSKLHPFPDHPFAVRDDDTMQQTVESIKQYGVLVPAIARPREDGGYELIAGHRRKYACELAGLKTMPVIIRDVDRIAATIIMVDSNLQRENILPSERAKAYKMKLDAIKQQGARHDLTSVQPGQKLVRKSSRDLIAENSPDSSTQIQRYIRLTELEPQLLQMVDEGKMALTPAVEISRLPIEAQRMLHRECELCDCTPSYSQTVRMRKINEVRELTWHDLAEIMSEEKANQKEKVTLFMDDLKKYYKRTRF